MAAFHLLDELGFSTVAKVIEKHVQRSDLDESKESIYLPQALLLHALLSCCPIWVLTLLMHSASHCLLLPDRTILVLLLLSTHTTKLLQTSGDTNASHQSDLFKRSRSFDARKVRLRHDGRRDLIISPV